MGTVVLSCRVADYDALTNTCSAPFFQQLVPTLGMNDVKQICYSIAFVWAVGWGIRQLKRMLR